MMLMSGRNYVWQVRMSNGCGKNLKIEQLVGIICVRDIKETRSVMIVDGKTLQIGQFVKPKLILGPLHRDVNTALLKSS